MKIVILSTKPRLYSTRVLVKAARNKGHEAVVVDHTKCTVIMEKGKPSVHYKGKAMEGVDAIIPRIGASVTFYGTAVVRQFEAMKVFSVLGSQALVRARDKLRSLQILTRAGLAVPKTAFAKFPKDDDVDDLIKEVGGAPIIVKLLEGTQGLGVVLAETDKAAKSVIEAFSGLKQNIIIQEYIQESGGADIRVLVVEGKVIGAMKRQGMEGEFRSNLHRGGKSAVIKLSPKEERAALNAVKALGLSVAGVDMLQSDRGPLIIEVNASPGLKGIETTTKKDVAAAIIRFVERSTKRKTPKRDTIKS